METLQVVRQIIERGCVEYRPALLRYAYRCVGNHEDAEDIVGQVILAALENTERFHTAKNLLQYMVGTTRCMAKEWGRKRREDATEPDDFDVLIETDRRDWVSVDLANEARYRLRHASLSDAERDCLRLRLQGLRWKEIAAQLEMPVATVRTQLRRAVMALRSCNVWHVEDVHEFGYLFWECSRVAIYRPPRSTGAALAQVRLRQMR